MQTAYSSCCATLPLRPALSALAVNATTAPLRRGALLLSRQSHRPRNATQRKCTPECTEISKPNAHRKQVGAVQMGPINAEKCGCGLYESKKATTIRSNARGHALCEWQVPRPQLWLHKESVTLSGLAQGPKKPPLAVKTLNFHSYAKVSRKHGKSLSESDRICEPRRRLPPLRLQRKEISPKLLPVPCVFTVTDAITLGNTFY